MSDNTCDLCCDTVNFESAMDPEDMWEFLEIAEELFSGCRVEVVCDTCKYRVLYEFYRDRYMQDV